MDILIISNEDICRSRMAQEILNSFGRGMKISTAGITEGSAVPDVVCQVMQRNGYELSRKKPVSLFQMQHRPWDCVITLTEDAEKEILLHPFQTDVRAHFSFADPLTHAVSSSVLEEQISELFRQMYRQLYEFFRDQLSERLAPRCTCGANDYCRCE